MAQPNFLIPKRRQLRPRKIAQLIRSGWELEPSIPGLSRSPAGHFQLVVRLQLGLSIHRLLRGLWFYGRGSSDHDMPKEGTPHLSASLAQSRGSVNFGSIESEILNVPKTAGFQHKTQKCFKASFPSFFFLSMPYVPKIYAQGFTQKAKALWLKVTWRSRNDICLHPNSCATTWN